MNARRHLILLLVLQFQPADARADQAGGDGSVGIRRHDHQDPPPHDEIEIQNEDPVHFIDLGPHDYRHD